MNTYNFRPTGVCPVCNGSGQVPLTDEEKSYSWNRDKTSKNCHNCGGQYMFGSASGLVPLNKNGDPCVHEYEANWPYGRNRGITDYKCKHCGDSYTIDSTD